MISGVYKLLCIDIGEYYIDSSQNLRKREQDHFSLLRNSKHPNKYLQNVFNKYNNLSFIVIEECNVNVLIEREQHHIDALKPKYNIRPIAESNKGWKMSQEAKDKIGNFNRGKVMTDLQKKTISEKNKVAMMGRKLSNSHIEAIRQARTGYSLSEETKNKIRNKAIGRDLGRKLKDETKAAIALALNKKVYQYTLDGKLIQEFISTLEAAKLTGGNHSAIAACCRGNRLTHKNFKWYYEKQDN